MLTILLAIKSRSCKAHGFLYTVSAYACTSEYYTSSYVQMNPIPPDLSGDCMQQWYYNNIDSTIPWCDINTYRTSTNSVYYLVVPLGKRQHSHSNAVKNTHYCLAVNLHSTVAPTIMPAVLSPLYSVVAASSRSSTCIMRSASRGCPCFVLSLRARAGNFDTGCTLIVKLYGGFCGGT